MFISIHELELHEIQFSEQIKPDVIDFGSDVRQKTALTTTGRAALISEHHGRNKAIEDIRLVGDFATRLEMRCARCLEPVLHDVQNSFDLIYRPLGSDAGVEERSIGGGDAEIGYYEGEGLLLEDALREQVLLAMPLKTVCRDDCKGLCPHCGRNLNNESCDCSEAVEDARWEALKDLRNKLQQ
ncbi:MAG: DUF177 domain-containing protein [Acidobacteriaceae bacterium]|nr:DUF177 domain-containing protein [Acidobacteriaceae bacterium]